MVVHIYGDSIGHNDQPTSIAAAARVLPAAHTAARRVLDFIRSQEWVGATDDEVEIVLKMQHQTASARRRGLVLTGWVVDSGVKRKTRSGSLAIVWIVKGEAP